MAVLMSKYFRPQEFEQSINKNSNFTLGIITAKRKFFAKIAFKEIHLSGHRVGPSLQL